MFAPVHILYLLGNAPLSAFAQYLQVIPRFYWLAFYKLVLFQSTIEILFADPFLYNAELKKEEPCMAPSWMVASGHNC